MIETQHSLRFGISSARTRTFGRPEVHRHDEVELNYIEQGTLDLSIGGLVHTLEAGELAVFWGAVPHRIVRSHRMTMLNWLTVPLADVLAWPVAADLREGILAGEMVKAGGPLTARRDLELMRTWQRDLATGTAARADLVLDEVRARLMRLSFERRRDITLMPGVRPESRAHRIAAFLRQHAGSRLKAADAAAAVGLKPARASVLFKEAFGVSMMDYLTRYRVAEAQRRLVAERAPIAEIATEVGFASLSQFYAAFRTHVGRPPKAVRAQAFAGIKP